jgi:hypothetical protein
MASGGAQASGRTDDADAVARALKLWPRTNRALAPACPRCGGASAIYAPLVIEAGGLDGAQLPSLSLSITGMVDNLKR